MYGGENAKVAMKLYSLPRAKFNMFAAISTLRNKKCTSYVVR